MKVIIAMLIVVLLIIACQKKTAKGVQNIDPKLFAEKLKSTENPQLLDVRTPEEYAEGKIDEAENVDWYADDFADKAAKYDKSKPVFVYCKAGIRGRKAANKLAELGFTEIYNLEGGIDKWNKSNRSQTQTTNPR